MAAAPGGLVVLDGRSGDVRHAVTFAYVPERLLHGVEDGAETIRLSCDLDATDDLERGDAAAEQLGVAHRVAAFRALGRADDDTVLVLAFGARTIPVRLAAMEIAEEAFDRALHPIRATVSLRLIVAGTGAAPVAARLGGRFEAEQERLAGLGAQTPPGFGVRGAGEG